MRRSRKEFIDNQIAQSQIEDENHLKKDSEVTEEHKRREQRATQEKAKVAQSDFEKERERLLNERNEHDNLDKEHRFVEKNLLNLQTRSKVAHDEEERKLTELEMKKKTIKHLL